MKSEITADGDSELRQRILTGLAAAAELETRFRQPLERFLFSLCDRSDGRSRERSVEIAGQVLAECYVKNPSLLERWQGPDNLEAFLRTAAKNRLKSWWSSADKKRTDVDSDSARIANARSHQSDHHPDELRIAEQALLAGVSAALDECPEGMVFMRLKGLHGVDQRAISSCWGHHEAQTSRRIKEAMSVIRTRAVEGAAAMDCGLSMDLLQQILQLSPGLLLGKEDSGLTNIDHPLLTRLAAGSATPQEKAEAVRLMSSQPQSLAFFAQILNRRNEHEALIVRDPALSGSAARLNECARRSLEIMQPSEAAGLVTPTMADLFADLLDHIRADGGTLWLLCPGTAALEAVFNPLEPEIAGKRQPLASGIISLVLATGETACVSGVPDHNRHSPGIDMVLGKTTHSMIAVPFLLEGTIRGVLTAVRFSEDGGFGDRETAVIGRCAEILAKLMVQNLAGAIME
jgi:DNA-directed RNA polymerase specialized sigma24 family protein/putative methionine-R-sulfoxide reductase with GAF domain